MDSGVKGVGDGLMKAEGREGGESYPLLQMKEAVMLQWPNLAAKILECVMLALITVMKYLF